MSKRTLSSFVSLIALLGPALCRAQEYTITTAAGGVNPHYFAGPGDGGQATAAGLGNPAYDVAVDGKGNLYIVAGSLVRKVTTSGIISTVAGGGGSVGDYVLATQADLTPTAIAVDSAGDLFIADSSFGISRVREVDTKGIISTVAGGAPCCVLGDGGPAITAYVGIPWGLAVDSSGNLYIAQADNSGNNLIREVSTDGTISTVAGGGTNPGDWEAATSAKLARPAGVAVDNAGNLYIAEAGANRVRKVSKSGTISTLATIPDPWHIAMDASGYLYVTQYSGATVRVVTVTSGLGAVAGTGAHGFSGDGGPAIAATLDLPAGIAVDGKGDIYVADATAGTARVRLLTPGPAPTAPPVISPGGIISAYAFGAFPSVAPGSWIEIYGTNLAADARPWTGADFNGLNAATLLDKTTVTVGGQLAFPDYVSAGQVNVQVPSNAGTGPQPVVVTTAAGASAPLTITVNAEEPGLLAPPSFKIGATQYVVAFFPDFATYVAPPGAIPGVTSRRAKPGDVIAMWGIGFGAVTPNVPAGQIVQQSNTLASAFHISIGSSEATVQYDAIATGSIGLYQFNVVVPNVGSSDAVPVTFTLGGVAGTQTLYIAVQN